ncbi:MAG: acyltransferase family protein [Bacteroidales bacterium]
MKEKSERLYSLDALRGFDMFWIMGGESLFIALGAATGLPWLRWWAEQMEHVSWHGFHFYDMIFPLFLFIAGISFPFSLAKRANDRPRLYRHIIQRGLILVLLGIVYNNAIRFNFSEMRYASVLGRIGLAWMFAALIYMNAGKKFRIIWTLALLLIYWGLLAFFPARDLGVFDPYSMEGSLTGYIDRLFCPGKLYLGIHDPEGILGTVPAISTALLGMLTGSFIKSEQWKERLWMKALALVLAGVVLLIIGGLWDKVFPINKNLWTSSFVCWVGGISLILFALFYLVIDVWGFKTWAFPFVVIGMNSITIYMAQPLLNLGHTAQFLFGGFTELASEAWKPVISSMGYIITCWIFLYILYRKKIFLKV